ncbi:MAG: riboflavin biosynthesis protein RibF [Oscillibacter sp.]|nr:riboflavin biosynthesis protein RibF [Oscillibacter sp.]
MSNSPKVIALGFFDGVHLGHGALLRRTAEEAKDRGVSSAIFTFAQPPKEVVTGIPCPLINSPEDRADLVRRLYGIDEVIMVPFDQEMMTTSWQDFVTEILVKRYHAVHLVAGHDHHFGHKNQGSPALLQEKCAEIGLGCDIIPEVVIDGITASSSYIRQLVAAGEMERAADYLGHPHTLSQTVQHGRRIGRTIGIPTINLVPPPHVLVPAFGVYAAKVTLPDGRSFPAVTNVGVRPTVNNGQDVTIEPWLLGFDGDLYGQTVRLEFYRHLRGEVRFQSLNELKAQIQKDAEATRQYFSEH